MNFLLIMLMLYFGVSYADMNLWGEFKAKYLKEKSYVVDYYNNSRVTSESQGYGMILAVKFDDKEIFDSIWKWTKYNMRREDNLFSWQWNNYIVDKNNATDGDLLISYALYLAYNKWNEESYKQEYIKILKSLKNLEIVIEKNNSEKDYLLLPAAYGFSDEKYNITIYPSYYIPFILKEFSQNDKDFNNLYRFLNVDIIHKSPLTTTLRYNLILKNLSTGEFLDMDVYRLIPYYLMAKKNIDMLKPAFDVINEFFNKNGYIPLRFSLRNKNQEKSESPFCVYRWFYLLYNNKKYLDKYESLKSVDKNNYFCDVFELFLLKR